MKIALAQMNVLPGRPKKNIETILSMIKEAKNQGVDLISFPEMCVGGYLVGDRWNEDNYCKNLMEFNQLILEASKGTAITWGNVYLDQRKGLMNKDGRTRKYNAVYVAQDGKWMPRVNDKGILPTGIQPKTLLPNYRFFDDQRYFFSLEDIAKEHGTRLEELSQPFLIRLDDQEIPIGISTCEDLWCDDYIKENTCINPTKYVIDNGAKLVINHSASPWTFGKNKARDKRVKARKKENGENFVPYLYVNNVGAQNNGKNIITFDGGSTAYNCEGDPIIFDTSHYQEELIIFNDGDLKKTGIERVMKTKIAEKYSAIITGINHLRDIKGTINQQKFVIGLSGGIDSAVDACLLSIAVGKENVIAVNMPTEYNSEKTKSAALYIANKLGLAYTQLPISGLVAENQKLLESSTVGNNHLSSLNEENLQAKIRGTSVLSNLAAMNGAIFTNNANKLEIALGYATLYGDVNGAVAPLADLTKVEVFMLAKYLNEEIFHDEIIPSSLIPDELYSFKEDQIAPSAELKNNQVDPIKFGYHDALIEVILDYSRKTIEDVMQWYLEGTMESNLGISSDLLRRWDLDNPDIFMGDLEWFTKKINDNVFKRVQAPPIIITSKSSYGYDHREAQLPYETTLRFDRLKDQILNMKKYETKVSKNE